MKLSDYDFIIDKLPKNNILISGSYKRHIHNKNKVIGDLDLIVVNKSIDQVLNLFEKHFNVIVKRKGANYINMVINSVYPVDVWITTKENLPFAQLQYDSGLSILHIKKKAKMKGLKLSQYGLFKGDTRINKTFKTSEEIKNYINSL